MNERFRRRAMEQIGKTLAKSHAQLTEEEIVRFVEDILKLGKILVAMAEGYHRKQQKRGR